MTDRLAHVKAFYLGCVLDGFGQRRFVGQDGLPEHVKLLHNRILPALYRAIRADDPDYDPHGEFVDGRPPTQARGTGAVRWFVEIIEGHKAFQQMIDQTGDLYTMLYKPSAQYGCFLDDLTAALRRDDPEWRGPLP
ncbi:hypothetical protein IU501_10975 [Nocardia otitidiscaviarum]|uniref:hypothetical protein n=1 Tax=Nocardia otitidiscaviarum TaxID=1823 RepID=UPI0018958A2E|nr:hypothetical protein [Nocardia otitidiscaviarum]MBF6133522.1 hypothetical protein [Nocardia otitidiscaviarum]